MPKANYEKSKEMYPSVNLDEDGWVKFFSTPQGFQAMGHIIGDIYKEVIYSKSRETSKPGVGRRPALPEVPLDEVLAVVFPAQFTTDPFKDALQLLVQGRSQAVFAKKIPVTQSTVSKWLSGSLIPDMDMMTRIAQVSEISPAYFREYRALFLAELVKNTYIKKPNLSIAAFKEVRSGKQKFDNR